MIYAQYFNRRHHRTGHLFENRYKSILCDEDNYLLALVRYIHLNPIRAGIVKTIEELDRYPWSGHRAIIGKAENPWMDIANVQAQFGGTRSKALKEYRGGRWSGTTQGTDRRRSSPEPGRMGAGAGYETERAARGL